MSARPWKNVKDGTPGKRHIPAGAGATQARPGGRDMSLVLGT